MTTPAKPLRERVQAWVEETQDELITALERLDGKRSFERDEWQRDGGGGGLTAVLSNGGLFEQAGVNRSAVWG